MIDQQVFLATLFALLAVALVIIAILAGSILTVNPTKKQVRVWAPVGLAAIPLAIVCGALAAGLQAA
jgi:heme A synthase